MTELVNIKNSLTTLEFSVKDADVLNKINELQDNLSIIEFKVKDLDVKSAINSLESTITSTELQVKDSSAVDLLTSIDSKLDNLSIKSSQVPEIQNITINSANTEQSITLPQGCKQYTLRVRNNSAKLQLAFNAGQSNSSFLTIPRGCNYSQNFVELTTAYSHLYIQSNKDNVTVECISWQ